MSKNDNLSIFLSLVLRHKPEAANITVDEHGWANVDELLKGINDTGRCIDMQTLEVIVSTDKKQRYSFNDDKTKIRANQGHSIQVDVGLREVEPPEFLYHGTASRFIADIKSEGLKPMSRLYVHLSKDIETAKIVGKRHGKIAVFKVKAKKMYENGYRFYLSENNVWMIKHVPSSYLQLMTFEGNVF